MDLQTAGFLRSHTRLGVLVNDGPHTQQWPRNLAVGLKSSRQLVMSQHNAVLGVSGDAGVNKPVMTGMQSMADPVISST